MMWIKGIIPILILFIVCNVYAEKPINEKYSYKAFPYHDLSFKDRPASEFNNTTIIGSCFYQHWRKGDNNVVKDIFPDGMTGVFFKQCNLDNIYIPSGNTMKIDGWDRSTNKRIKQQNDLSDWILDKNLKPLEPMNKKGRLELGISAHPNDIPLIKMKKNIVIKAMEKNETSNIIFTIP